MRHCWTADDKYVLSGSDEMNVRLKGARQREARRRKEREWAARQYNERLVEKFAITTRRWAGSRGTADAAAV